jgi:crotonobetainyl-CoA:carnitine CoA-transferase CaiB-like acyl-CoA transferase
MRVDLAHGSGASLPAVRTPIVMSKTPLTGDRGAPLLGEHTAEILAELGHDQAQIERLVADSVVGRRAPRAL